MNVDGCGGWAEPIPDLHEVHPLTSRHAIANATGLAKGRRKDLGMVECYDNETGLGRMKRRRVIESFISTQVLMCEFSVHSLKIGFACRYSCFAPAAGARYEAFSWQGPVF